jgi:transposase
MQSKGLDELYRTTKDPRLRTRAQMVLLAAEQRPTVPQIAAIVREREAPVLRWLKRYRAEDLNGLQDAPPPRPPMGDYRGISGRIAGRGAPAGAPSALPFFLWTLQCLADYLAERRGLRVSDETVRRALKHAGIGLSRPQHTISRPDPE